MGESLIEKLMRFRIQNILNTSDYMKEDIWERHHMTEKQDEDDLSLSDESPYKYREDYSFGWKDIIQWAIENKVSSGFIFTGPDGCGKHTAAEVAYYALCHNDMPEEYDEEEEDEEIPDPFFLFLSAKDLVFTSFERKADEEERYRSIEQGTLDTYTDDIIHRFFECLFHQAAQEGEICLVIDNTDQLDMKAVYDRLGQYLCISQVQQIQEMPSSDPSYVPPLFVIIIDKEANDIPSLLHRKLLLIRMSLPNLAQRKALLENMGIYDELIEATALATENYTYAQLRSLAKNTQLYATFEENPDGMFYDEITRSQVPIKLDSIQENDSLMRQPSSIPEENDKLTEAKVQLYQKLSHLVEQLPELLEKMGSLSVAIPQAADSANQAKEETPLSLSQLNMDAESIQQQGPPNEAAISDECGNMAFGDIFSSIMGQERVRKIGLNRT